MHKLSSIFLSKELLPPSPVKKITNGLLLVLLHMGGITKFDCACTLQ